MMLLCSFMLVHVILRVCYDTLWSLYSKYNQHTKDFILEQIFVHKLELFMLDL